MTNLELEIENKRLLAYMRIIMDQACTPQTLTDPGSVFNRIINLTAAAISHSNNAPLADPYISVSKD